MHFKDKLSDTVSSNNSLLCIGLDIDQDEMPKYLFEGNDDPFLENNRFNKRSCLCI